MREWRLRTSLIFLLVATTLVTLGIVGSLILLVRLPQIAERHYVAAQNDAEELANRVELLLNSLQARLEPLGVAIQALPPQTLYAFLDTVVGDGSAFDALYVVSPTGIVEAVGVTPNLRQRREELLGSDLSANRLYRSARARQRPTWSDQYLSALSGNVTVGLAVAMGERVVIGEIPPQYLLRTLRAVQISAQESVWVIDRKGELIADTDSPSKVGMVNLFGLPLVQTVLRGESLPRTFEHQGRTYYPAMRHSQALNWYFLVRTPAGLDNDSIRSTIVLVVIGFVGSLVIGSLLAPLWAARMAQPVQELMALARQIAEGDPSGSWPRGAIAEFNHLSADLERMAAAIQERQQKIQAIFNASPVPMVVSDPLGGSIIVEVNDAWIQQFGRSRAEVIGRSGLEIGLWQSAVERAAILEAATQEGGIHREACLIHGDGHTLLCAVTARQVKVGGHSLTIWAMEDVTEKRRIDRELRKLNAELEARVLRRTEDLAQTNRELSETVTHLRQAQQELVRAEKMAALGELVAGVAHELNTPIGNALIAASTVPDKVREFQRAMQEGLRRSTLDQFISHVATAADLTTRNLYRAADLLTSFKQVAVDQASSQRRVFELKEVVGEILTTLHPTLKRTPYRIVVEVPEGLRLDSYPGPLGQTLANLINNAVLHAFEGLDQGAIRILADRVEDGRIRARVADDGKGIPAALLGRIFHPFFTTKMGRGGTGLGLHIAYNAVTNILGGSLTVRSEEGKGTEFEMLLPEQAPRTASDVISARTNYSSSV